VWSPHVRQPATDGREDAVEVLADRFAHLHERRDAAPLRPTAPSAEHGDHLLIVEIAREDRPQGLLEFVGTSQCAALPF